MCYNGTKELEMENINGLSGRKSDYEPIFIPSVLLLE